MSEEETKRRIDLFAEKVARTEYEFLRNEPIADITAKRVKVKYAVRRGRLEEGISYATYGRLQSYIDEKIEDALQRRRKAVEAKNWVVQGLAGNIGQLLYQKAIPRDVYAKLRDHVRYYSREDLEELDMFGSEPGWDWDQEAVAILKAEAAKEASPERRKLASELVAERTAREKQEAAEEATRKMRRAKAIDDAKHLDKKYGGLLADWSWDDYRYRVGKTVEETSDWAVHEYEKQRDIGIGDWKVVGYNLKQKLESENKIGVIGYSEYSSRDPLELARKDPPSAVRAMKKGLGD